jgi:hypothetical protein
MTSADTASLHADIAHAESHRGGLFSSRRAFLSSALLLPAGPLLASQEPTHLASASKPKVLAGYLAGAIEPGGCLEKRVLNVLSPHAAGAVSWMPWARAMVSAANGNCLLFPLARTPEREAAWQWLAPLARDRFVLVLSRDVVDRGEELAELRQLRVGSVRSAFVIGRLMALGFQNIDVAPAELANAKKLALGRIDAWATVASVAYAIQANQRLPAGAQIVPLDRSPFTMWLAASSDLNPALLLNASRQARFSDDRLPGVFDAKTL